MKNTILKLLAALLLLLPIACLDVIDLEVGSDLTESFSFNGFIKKGNPSVVEVVVNRVFDFDPSSLRPIVVRSITVQDETGGSVELELVGTGLYRAIIPANDPNLAVEIGKSYSMSITTFDGRTYESSLETILDVPKPDNIAIGYTSIEREGPLGTLIQDTLLQCTINTPLTVNDAPTRLRWSFQRTYRLTDTPPRGEPKTCYITENIGVNNIAIFDATESTIDRIDDFPLFTLRPDYTFSEGIYINVLQEALSEAAYTYWDQINQVLNRTGNMFEAPAGRIITNFQNINDAEDPVFGYFYAANVDTVRLFVSPEFAGNPTRLCPPPPGPPGSTECLVQTCCDCLTDEISTLERPSYWQE